MTPEQERYLIEYLAEHGGFVRRHQVTDLVEQRPWEALQLARSIRSKLAARGDIHRGYSRRLVIPIQ